MLEISKAAVVLLALSLALAGAASAQGPVLPLPAADQQRLDSLLGVGVVGKALPSAPIEDPTHYFPLQEKTPSYKITSGKHVGETQVLNVQKGKRPGGNPAWRFQLSPTLAGFLRNTVEGDLMMTAVTDADEGVVVITTLVHESGAMTVIDNSRQAVYGFDQRVEAFGSLGMAASENPLAHTGLVRTKDGTQAATLPYFFLERYVPSYLREWDAFVNAYRNGLPSPVGGAAGRAPLAIGLAAFRSHREGRPVLIGEIG